MISAPELPPPHAVPPWLSQNTKEWIHGIGAEFPLTVLLVSVSVPELLIPPPAMARMVNAITTTVEALPLRMVIFERVTWVALEMVTTVAVPLPSIIGW